MITNVHEVAKRNQGHGPVASLHCPSWCNDYTESYISPKPFPYFSS